MRYKAHSVLEKKTRIRIYLQMLYLFVVFEFIMKSFFHPFFSTANCHRRLTPKGQSNHTANGVQSCLRRTSNEKQKEMTDGVPKNLELDVSKIKKKHLSDINTIVNLNDFIMHENNFFQDYIGKIYTKTLWQKFEVAVRFLLRCNNCALYDMSMRLQPIHRFSSHACFPIMQQPLTSL